jgi:hypothetical protein
VRGVIKQHQLTKTLPWTIEDNAPKNNKSSRHDINIRTGTFDVSLESTGRVGLPLVRRETKTALQE